MFAFPVMRLMILRAGEGWQRRYRAILLAVGFNLFITLIKDKQSISHWLKPIWVDAEFVSKTNPKSRSPFYWIFRLSKNFQTIRRVFKVWGNRLYLRVLKEKSMQNQCLSYWRALEEPMFSSYFNLGVEGCYRLEETNDCLGAGEPRGTCWGRPTAKVCLALHRR